MSAASLRQTYRILWLLNLIGLAIVAIASIVMCRAVGDTLAVFYVMWWGAPVTLGQFFLVTLPSLIHLFANQQKPGAWWLFIVSLFGVMVVGTFTILAITMPATHSSVRW